MILSAAILLTLAQAAGESGQDVQVLVEKLRSDSLEVRRGAEGDLRKRGTSALDALKKAAEEHKDSEVRARARVLVADILFATRGKIAYFGTETEKKHNLAAHALFVVDPEEGKPQKVLGTIYGTYNGGGWEIKWVSGLRKILLSVDIPQEERHGDGVFPNLWSVNDDGCDASKLTVCGTTTDYALSRDGKRIVYVAYDMGGGSNLHIVDIDGTVGKPLTTDFTKVWEPAWSPDGKGIVFRGFNAKERGTYLVAPDGTSHERLHAEELSCASFTPGGKSIVALEHDLGGSLKTPRRVYVLDLATKRLTRIGKNAAKGEHAWWGSPVRLSPDGRKVVYVRHESCEIVLVDLDGKNEEVVAKGISPTWSPDGKRLAYQRVEEPKGIFVTHLDTRRETKLADGMLPSWSR